MSRSGRWLWQMLPMSLGALLLALWNGVAVAQTPIKPTKARLSIEGSKPDDTRYPGILLPDGSHTDYGYDACSVVPGLKLKLDV